MKLKQLSTISCIFFSALTFAPLAHAIFNKDDTNALLPVSENFGNEAIKNLNLAQAALNLQYAGKDAAEILNIAMQKLQNVNIQTQSNIHVTFDPKTHALLADVWLFLKERGPRISSGIIFMTAGMFLFVDGIKRITTSNERFIWKTLETAVGVILAGGGAYLVLR